MIELNNLLDERAFGHDLESLQAANEYLERLLFATARKHNQVWEELESMKDSSGLYDKPLPFLSFPREVRDQIYTYALQAPREAFVGVRHIRMLSCDTFPDSTHYPFKPPTPGLLLASKQIYEEAVQVLYSCNNFSFHKPRELFDFQSQVGVYNCALVRQMKISVVFEDESTQIPSEYVAPCDYENIPSHWAKALMESRLMNNIVGMQIDANSGSHEMRLMTMPPALYRAILATFFRNRNAKTAPELILKGFQTQEVDKFPMTWKKSTEQWLEVEWAADDQEVDESEPFWNSSEVDPADTHSSWEDREASADEDGESLDENSSSLGNSSTGKGNVPTLFNELGELMGSDYTESDAESDVGSEDSFYTAAPWNDVKEVLLQFRSFQEAGQRQQGGLLGI
ncbi:3afd3d3d-1b04-4f8c-b00b-86cc05f57997-CDS [Sclerotinia trifoliorum]|uniref:3afd3d3d-1b04-4f8c-b00b-86cc05f57997-CDS n=1 Tax=Sclerotinia trifoliorum TaxID=28548 RepID=A0A8H2VWM8_9HELO|nr:3afd3d3d-1b04-4f8c-b00b-86cc05f57997-CDS [Sclerotinia trifoliorum]